MITSPSLEIQLWPIDRFIPYARNPRKNDPAVDRRCGGIREFGFKIPVLARSNGEVVDGHSRLKHQIDTIVKGISEIFSLKNTSKAYRNRPGVGGSSEDLANALPRCLSAL